MSLPSLYLIADRTTCAPRKLETVIEEALEAGVRLVQLRETGLASEKLVRLAQRLLAAANAFGARLLINTDAGLACRLGAAGVHLPASAPDPASVRARFGKGFLIGCSTHDLRELDRATAGGADLVTFSPVYRPGSKPDYAGPAVGLNGLRAAVRATDVPVYALGGITPDRVAVCREAGAAGMAVMSGILQAADVRRAVVDYQEAWGTGAIGE